MDNNKIEITLPNGLKLRAVCSLGDPYPSIDIFLDMPDGKSDLLCFAEYNPDKDAGNEVCIGAYSVNQDDVDYYESYKWGDFVEE